MRTGNLRSATLVRQSISRARPSIYDPPASELTGLYYTPQELELLLSKELVGLADLDRLPVRTRSKVAKQLVCRALGYDAPATFLKVAPRLRHPNIDVYCQQSNNLQVWNQEVDAARRYVILILRDGIIGAVRVIAGASLALLDTTGTLTSKFQAERFHHRSGSTLVSPTDTSTLVQLFNPLPNLDSPVSPVEPPTAGRVLDIRTIFNRLLPIVGQSFINPGSTQERLRGAVVHEAACQHLGLSHFADHGQFPDVLSQLLEIKLQLARTIDLGLELPDSSSPVASTNGVLSVADMRYAVFYAEPNDRSFTVTDLVVVAGRDFFTEFRQFQGNISNSKLQLRLPPSWFF